MPMISVTGESPVALEVLQAAPETYQQSQIELLLGVMAANDLELCAHGRRTASYAVALGTTVGLSGADVLDLYLAALLHDIGRLTLSTELLRKQEPLTAEEYTLVQCHPRAGAELLEPIPFLRIPAVLIALHHERWDGTGYPYGVRGSFIPLGSRILAVADTFDALTSSHFHGQPQSPETALRLLQVAAGSQLDPDLVEMFVRLVPAFRASHGTGSAADGD